MNNYQEMMAAMAADIAAKAPVEKIAQEILNTPKAPEAPKKAPEMDIVQKTAVRLLNGFEKVAKEVELTEEALKLLGLQDMLYTEPAKQDMEQTDPEEQEGIDEENAGELTQDDVDISSSAIEEGEDDAELRDEAELEEEDEDVKLATMYLRNAYAIEKEANLALNEAELIKIAAIQVLLDSGKISMGHAEKLASLQPL